MTDTSKVKVHIYSQLTNNDAEFCYRTLIPQHNTKRFL